MTGLVLELQRDALNSKIKVSDLLRKALFVSKKLDVFEIEEWINNELNGYSEMDEIPEYRTMNGQIKVNNPYNGWQPVFFEDTKKAERFLKITIRQSVSALDNLLEANVKNNVNFSQTNFERDDEKFLMSLMQPIPLQPYLIIYNPQIFNILESVRHKILNWSLELKLEQRGTLGEVMSFSEKEKQLTHQTTNISIQNMHNSQLQLDSPNATQSLNVTADSADLKKLVEDLKNAIDDLALQHEQREELKEAIAMLSIQANSAKPNPRIISESARTARNIIEGTVASVIGSELYKQLYLFL